MATRGRPRRLLAPLWLFTIRWDAKGRKLLERLAKRRGKTMSDVVRDLVVEATDRDAA